MTADDVLVICLDLPAAEETYPFGENVAVIKVRGKMFALVPLSEGPGSINLKCEPGRALELREAYTGIRPGYHQNKRHWNTVELDGSVEDDVVRGLIEDSYDLVVAALPRAARAELEADLKRTDGQRAVAPRQPPQEATSPSATTVASVWAIADGYSGSRSSHTTSHDPKSCAWPSGRAKNQTCKWAPPSPMR